MHSSASVLKSKLRFICEDLKNIVCSDLEECKWPMKRLIFSSLLSHSKLLSRQSDELHDIEKTRAAQLKLEKTNPPAREIRLENETAYRTSFLKVVLDALTQLKWPVALEPFSDALGSLFSDNDSVLYAIEYIVNVGFPDVNSSSLFDDKSHDSSLRSSHRTLSTASQENAYNGKLTPNYDSMPFRDADASDSTKFGKRVRKNSGSRRNDSSIKSGAYAETTNVNNDSSQGNLSLNDYDSLAKAYKVPIHSASLACTFSTCFLLILCLSVSS